MAAADLKSRPAERPSGAGGGAAAFRSAAFWTAGLCLAAFLIWRTAAALLAGPRPEGSPTDLPGPRPPAEGGDGGNANAGTMTIHEPDTGMMVLSIRAGKTVIRGNLCQMERVEVRRVLGRGRGELLASGERGNYDRSTSSGVLEGKVVVRRFLPGRKEPDVVLHADSLAWDQAGGVLSTPGPADMTWVDPRTGRRVIASGTGILAESETQRVRLERDVKVSMTDRGLPDSLPVSRRRRDGSGRSSTAVTVITCAGPAFFENETALGAKRMVYNREVRATREDARLTCDQLEVWLAPDRGRSAGPSAGLSAVELSAAAPDFAAGSTRFLSRALAARPPATADGQRGEGDSVDLVIARGAVTMTGRDGTGRGEMAWYDRPAGIVWLDGGTREPAEILRNGSLLVARSFYYDVRTEELSTVGEGAGKVILDEKGNRKPPR